MAWVVPSRTTAVLEFMERIAIRNLRSVFQLAAEKEISDAQPLKGRPNFLNSRHR